MFQKQGNGLSHSVTFACYPPERLRFLETAVREAGVEPVIISSPSAAAGATPRAHTRCTVVKLHGDYLDPDLKHTLDELGSYDPAIDRLLDRVFDEYGLVVCGWAGEWDEALRNALLRSPRRRYGTYWARLGSLGERAAQLVAHRQAGGVPIQGADEFFEDLASKVSTSVAGLCTEHQMSPSLYDQWRGQFLANAAPHRGVPLAAGVDLSG